MAKLKAALRRVKWTPTLLVWGDSDCTVSLDSGVKLNRKLRNSELIVVPGCGHSVFEEMPEASNRIMLDWLTRHPLTQLRPRVASAAQETQATPAIPRLSPSGP
jgi:alpha-beta hydrolase superfamily lysophospholipase